MHVSDELLLVHHVHLQHELLLDHLGHGSGVLAIPPNFGQSNRGSSAESREETFLQPAGDVLGYVVVLRADDDGLVALRPIPAECRSHRYCC